MVGFLGNGGLAGAASGEAICVEFSVDDRQH